jgi:hypothetical protein
VLDVDHDRSREQRLLGRAERASDHDHERAGGDHDAGADTGATDDDERGATGRAHAADHERARGALPPLARARPR